MGDRVLMQVVDGDEFSPVVYGHWSGCAAGDVCERLRARMVGRSQDMHYTTARLAQEMIGDIDGNTGFGIWNAKGRLTENDSHGDAGIVLIDCSGETLTFSCFGGYLSLNKDGIPSAGDDEDEA